MKKNVWLLLLIVLALGCKARSERNDSSSVLEETILGTYPVDLTRYKSTGGLQTAEIEALKLYTREGAAPGLGGNFYTVVNRALRDNDQKILGQQIYNIMNVASGANKLRSGACTTRRFVDLPYSVASKLSTSGARYVDKAFFSSTLLTSPPAAFASRPEVIITESPNCPVIESYSSIPSEREVLFPPGTEFEVTRNSRTIRIGTRNYTAYYLKESNSGQKAQALNVGVGGQKADDEDGGNYQVATFAIRTYSGRDPSSGKKRSVYFRSNGSAYYTGASGASTTATWRLTSGKIHIVPNNTKANLWYQISNQDKICFMGESEFDSVTNSCLVYDEDDDGDVAEPVGAPQKLQPADSSITFRDFFDTFFDREGNATFHLNFLKNQAVKYYTDGDKTWSSATWTFFDSPARIQIKYSDNTIWWLHVVNRNRLCYVGTTYTGVSTGTCYAKK